MQKMKFKNSLSEKNSDSSMWKNVQRKHVYEKMTPNLCYAGLIVNSAIYILISVSRKQPVELKIVYLNCLKPYSILIKWNYSSTFLIEVLK